MFLDYVRTQEGNDELKNRSKRLNARQRALLLMIEQANANQKPMSQPWEHLATPENLDYLLDLGLIESVQPASQKPPVKTANSRSKKPSKVPPKKQPVATTPYIVKAPLAVVADNQAVAIQQELDTAALKQQLAQALEKLPATALLDNELVGLVEEKLVPALEAKAALEGTVITLEKLTPAEQQSAVLADEQTAAETEPTIKVKDQSSQRVTSFDVTIPVATSKEQLAGADVVGNEEVVANVVITEEIIQTAPIQDTAISSVETVQSAIEQAQAVIELEVIAAERLEVKVMDALFDNEILIEQRVAPALEAESALEEQVLNIEVPSAETQLVALVEEQIATETEATLFVEDDAIQHSASIDNSVPAGALSEEPLADGNVVDDVVVPEQNIQTALLQEVAVSELHAAQEVIEHFIQPVTVLEAIAVEEGETKEDTQAVELAALEETQPVGPIEQTERCQDISCVLDNEPTRVALPTILVNEKQPVFKFEPSTVIKIQHQTIVISSVSPALIETREPVAVDAGSEATAKLSSDHHAEVAITAELNSLEQEWSEIFSSVEAVPHIEATQTEVSQQQGLPPIPDDEQFDLAEEILINGKKPRYDAIPVLTWQIDHE